MVIVISDFDLFIGNKNLQIGSVGRSYISLFSQLSLRLGGLAVAVQKVALIGMGSLDLAGLGNGKALFGTAVRFNLGHFGFPPKYYFDDFGAINICMERLSSFAAFSTVPNSSHA